MIDQYKDYKIIKYSGNAISIEWKIQNFQIDFTRKLQVFINYLKKNNDNILYITPTFDSLLIRFKNPVNLNAAQEIIENKLQNFKAKSEDSINARTFQIPVCYEFGEDLETIANYSKLSIIDVIEIHSNQIYNIHFIGFLPGFLYLGEVDEAIQIPRKKTPRLEVKKGSVGIAENQSGIYSSNSPGGWQIVGKTPIEIFNANQNPPSKFLPGDQVKFHQISKSKYAQLLKDQPKLKPEND